MSETDPSEVLFPGEVADTIGGYPTIYHFQAALDMDRDLNHSRLPLIVCVPGAFHLARIFYGDSSADKHSSEDFLSYRLSQLGFNVLCVSYPLERNLSQAMPSIASQFNVKDWGKQIAQVTSKVADHHHLPRDVVLVTWSMGGRVVVPFSTSIRELGFNICQSISLAGPPGISRAMGPPLAELDCTPAGYAKIASVWPKYWSQLEEMSRLNAESEPDQIPHSAISQEIYFSQYVGAIPIRLIGLGLKYDEHSRDFAPDEARPEDDSQVFDVAHLPLVSAIYPTAIVDAHQALTNRAAWGFLLTYKLERLIRDSGALHRMGTAANAARWQQVMDLVHTATSKLCMPMRGNHFFFVGKYTAKSTAIKVAELIKVGSRLINELATLCDDVDS